VRTVRYGARKRAQMSVNTKYHSLAFLPQWWRALWISASGSQLLEFAMALPFLLVVLVGIIDFGGAYNLKQNLTNAAREGARIAVSNPLTNANCSDPQPCSIEASADAVAQYLTNAGLPASCISPQSPSSSGTLTWTYSCNGITLTINRGFVFNSTGGPAVSGTQVTLTYPVTWTFNRIIGLLVRGAGSSMPSTLTTSVVMQNLV
jgi:Flp pilus assembly protein TadG